MAIYYTDFLNGDDSTGNGSFEAPFKTIYKATQTISANDDEVRVKGSGWTDLPGTINLEHSQTLIATTSEDLTSFFPELSAADDNNKVVITVDDEWGIGKTVLTVVAVTPTELTLHNEWAGKTGTYSFKRLTTQHYYTTVNPVSPAGNSGYFDELDINNMINYTGLQITGGWTADGVRDGMTAFVNAAGNRLNTNYRGWRGNTNTANSLTWFYAGFAGINITSLTDAGNFRGQIGDFWFVRSNRMLGESNSRWFNKSGVMPNFYLYDCSGGAGPRWLGEGPPPTDFTFNLWHSIPRQPIGGGDESIVGNGKIFNQLHLRGANSNSSSIIHGNNGYFISNVYSNLCIIKEFYFYKSNVSTGQYFVFGSPFNGFQYFEIDKVFIEGVGTESSVYFAYGSSNSLNSLDRQWTIGDGTQTLDQLAIATQGDNGSKTFNPRKITDASFIINSNQGLYRWVPNLISNSVDVLVGTSSDFVTGTNALKLKLSKMNSGLTGNPLYDVPIAVLPNIPDIRTLTIKAKADANTVGSYSITIRAITPSGFASQQSLNIMQSLGSVNLTESYQDFAFSVDPSTFPVSATNRYPTTVFYAYLTYTPTAGSFVGDILIDSVSLT